MRSFANSSLCAERVLVFVAALKQLAGVGIVSGIRQLMGKRRTAFLEVPVLHKADSQAFSRWA